MRAQWAELQFEITNAMEKMNQLAGRLAKREARAMAKTLEEERQEVEAEPPTDAGRWREKAALMRRIKGEKHVRENQGGARPDDGGRRVPAVDAGDGVSG